MIGNIKKVMVFGSFDLLHKGHLNFFEQAKKKGDYLIVVLARDKNIEKAKNSLPKYSEKSRQQEVKQILIVDKAILGNVRDKYSVIKKYGPDVICLGYDQKVNLKELKEKIKEFGLDTKIYKLKAFQPDVYKSSKLKNKKIVSPAL